MPGSWTQKGSASIWYHSYIEGGKNLTVTVMGVSKTGTYELSGETLKMTFDGETATATYKDGVITWTKDGETMTLKKK